MSRLAKRVRKGIGEREFFVCVCQRKKNKEKTKREIEIQ